MQRDGVGYRRLPLFWFVLTVVTFSSLAVIGQRLDLKRKPDVSNGKRVYNSGCNTCHGETGKGAPQTSTVFNRPNTFPDFTVCSQTTPEADMQWKGVVVHGGPYKGFSTIMPTFGQLLSENDIDDVIAYMRTFCDARGWPRGELNLPRALVTEKAFPENELVISTSANATGAPSWETHAIHEQAFGKRDQLEVDVPWVLQDVNHSLESHTGDMTIGLKHVMFSSLKTGSILSLQGGVLPPTGSTKLGGAGTTVFEPFAAFDQLWRTNTWVQFQMGADLPVDTKKSPQSMFWYTALGQTIAQDKRLGRQWSPMVEFLANRDLVDGAKTDWDVLPEMQVTLSPRQHIRADIGVRTPFTNTAGRNPQVQFYILWDWADGKFWEGW
ncbi:c-type cytochrome [Occallatibacter riparius]|uniref:Cytochrome c n=1 Tax=Occallatibacter riparius TaxID=1002689 RepID=A0A9J7BQP5_9BACT|nr:cytochrome c [Occallatibacter riparius]UWZ84889.1 cytochrome c [Occallatibacter riparius]